MFKKFIRVFKKPDDSASSASEPSRSGSETPSMSKTNQPLHPGKAIRQNNLAKDLSLDEVKQQETRLRLAKAEKLNALQIQMAKELSPIELRELALDLSVSIEDLSGDRGQKLIREFIAHLERRGRIPDLFAALTERWPEVNWQAADVIQAINDLAQFRLYSQPSAQLLESWQTLLNNQFSLSELKTMAFDLGIYFDDLAGDDKPTKVDSLLTWAAKVNKWDELTAYVSRERPHAWKKAATSVSPPPSHAKQLQQNHQTLDSLSLNELQTICQRLGVDFEDLPGENKVSKVKDLLAYLSRENRLSDLEPLLTKLYTVDKATTAYHTHHIRALIFQVFPDDAALTDFCRQHLPGAVYEFGSGMSYRQKVQALLEFCTLKKQFTPLLAALEANFPEAYSVGGPYTQENPQPRPMPKPVQGKALLNDEWIDRAKREGRE